MHRISFTDDQLGTVIATFLELVKGEEDPERLEVLEDVITALQKQVKVMKCEKCGENFMASNPRQQTCSVKCRVAMHRGPKV